MDCGTLMVKSEKGSRSSYSICRQHLLSMVGWQASTASAVVKLTRGGSSRSRHMALPDNSPLAVHQHAWYCLGLSAESGMLGLWTLSSPSSAGVP